MFQVVELKSLAEIEPYESVWAELYDRTPTQQYTRNVDWFKWNVKQSGGSLQPHVLIVYVMNRAIGIVPMVIEKRRTSMGVMRVLSYLDATPFASCGQVGPNAAATLAGAMKHLRKGHRKWDLLDLRAIDFDGEDHHRTPNAMKNAGMNYHEKRWETALMIHADEVPLSLRDRPSLELLGFTLSCSESVPVDAHELLLGHEEDVEWLPFAERSGNLSAFVLRERGVFVAAVVGVRSGDTMTLPLWLGDSQMNPLVRDAFRSRILEETFRTQVKRCVISTREMSRGLSNHEAIVTRRYTVFSGKSIRGWVLSAHQTGKRWLRGTTPIATSGRSFAAVRNDKKDESLSKVVERLGEDATSIAQETQPMPRLQIYREQSANSA